MGRIEKQKREFIEESNKRMLNEQGETKDSWWDWWRDRTSATNNAVSALADGLPVHYRNVLKFLTMQNLTERNSDFTEEELSAIGGTLCEKSKKYGNCDPSKWPGNDKNLITPDDYGMNNQNPLSSYTQKLSKMSGVRKELSLGLGSSTVKDSGTYWLLTDNYDFINATEFPGRKAVYSSVFNLLPDMIVNTIGIYKGVDSIKYLEQALAWVHKTGYKGFGIELTIPKCQFCSKGNS